MKKTLSQYILLIKCAELIPGVFIKPKNPGFLNSGSVVSCQKTCKKLFMLLPFIVKI